MQWEKRYLDMTLVPGGLLIMLVYHLILLYKIVKFPHTTAIGYENHNKKAWAARVMNMDDLKDKGVALQVITSNIGVATYLSTLCIALSSLISTLAGSGSRNIFSSEIIYGDTSSMIITIKYVSLLSCFLAAFAFFIHSARHFVHVNFLLTTPNSKVPVIYVQKDVIKGSNYTTLGLRALYLAITLLLWIFGPIPMFACSVVMVSLLALFDSNSCPMHDYSYENKIPPLSKPVSGSFEITNQIPIRASLNNSKNLAPIESLETPDAKIQNSFNQTL